jgi:2-methylcitrate dehydratase PrpD
MTADQFSGCGATQELARFAASLQYDDIPSSAVEMAKSLFLDGLACLIVGTRGAPGRSAARTMKRLGGHPQSTIFTGDFKGSVRDAAFANAIALYSVGLNDIHKPSTSHPGGCIIAPLLAVAEWQNGIGREMIAAMVAGYDINGRLGSATAPSHRERGFHTTGTIGTFGATAAVGRMMRLDAEQLASAFGIAGSQAAGLYEFHHDGTLTMIFHAGRAAQNGVEASLLVQDGLSGPATVLEGSKGFCRATSNAFDEDLLVRDLGAKYYIEETSFRPYYGCSSTIAASGATEALLKRLGLHGSDLEEVQVRCHPVVAKDNFDPNPSTLLGARLSMQYNIALVLDRGEVVTADLGENDLWNPDVRRRMSKVQLTADDSMPRFGAVVTAVLNDGRREEQQNLVPRGDATQPLSFADVSEKFRRMAAPIAGEEPIKNIVSLVTDLEECNGRDLVAAISTATRG